MAKKYRNISEAYCVIVHISVSNKFAAVGISIVEFITVFARVRHWSLLCVKLTQSSFLSSDCFLTVFYVRSEKLQQPLMVKTLSPLKVACLFFLHLLKRVV